MRPQRGVRYFVSGGGGRSLYSVHKSDFDEVGISEHHFMIAEIAGDRLFFEAITQGQKLLDCGVLHRLPQVKADADETKWLEQCEAGRPKAITTDR